MFWVCHTASGGVAVCVDEGLNLNPYDQSTCTGASAACNNGNCCETDACFGYSGVCACNGNATAGSCRQNCLTGSGVCVVETQPSSPTACDVASHTCVLQGVNMTCCETDKMCGSMCCDQEGYTCQRTCDAFPDYRCVPVGTPHGSGEYWCPEESCFAGQCCEVGLKCPGAGEGSSMCCPNSTVCGVDCTQEQDAVCLLPVRAARWCGFAAGLGGDVMAVAMRVMLQGQANSASSCAPPFECMNQQVVHHGGDDDDDDDFDTTQHVCCSPDKQCGDSNCCLDGQVCRNGECGTCSTMDDCESCTTFGCSWCPLTSTCNVSPESCPLDCFVTPTNNTCVGAAVECCSKLSTSKCDCTEYVGCNFCEGSCNAAAFCADDGFQCNLDRNYYDNVCDTSPGHVVNDVFAVFGPLILWVLILQCRNKCRTTRRGSRAPSRWCLPCTMRSKTLPDMLQTFLRGYPLAQDGKPKLRSEKQLLQLAHAWVTVRSTLPTVFFFVLSAVSMFIVVMYVGGHAAITVLCDA